MDEYVNCLHLVCAKQRAALMVLRKRSGGGFLFAPVLGEVGPLHCSFLKQQYLFSPDQPILAWRHALSSRFKFSPRHHPGR